MTGAVLAGGHGTRMGRDKALLIWEGRPLWQRQVAVLRAAGCDPVGVVRRPGQSPLGNPCWRDLRTECGPLAGLEIALGSAGAADRVAVLAVDMPGIGADWFRWLEAHCQAGGGAVACQADRFEPLAAIFPRSALAEVSARLDRGELALQGLVRALAASGQVSAVPIPPARERMARSINTPDQISGGG